MQQEKPKPKKKGFMGKLGSFWGKAKETSKKGWAKSKILGAKGWAWTKKETIIFKNDASRFVKGTVKDAKHFKSLSSEQKKAVMN